MTRKSTESTRESQYQKTTLRNGLRVISERLPAVRSISIGVWIDVGSRNEREEENGLSHFIEHLVFKGTKRRNARQVASSLESLGGSLNAFTTREQTCYTARVLDEHFDQAMDVLADIACHATLTPTNMNRERLVICEEIKESLDNPIDRIHDLFASTYWGDHPLGRPIIGQQETITEVSRARLKDFMRRHYRYGSVVVAASGSVSHSRLVKLTREKFTFGEGKAEPAPPARRDDPGRVIVRHEDSSQTHFCLGFPGLAYNDRKKMAMLVLITHLGGGMSSVLFQKLREQRGLAYSVYAYHDFCRDTGIFGVYLGTDATRLRESYDLVDAECCRLKKRKLSSVALDQAKAQLKGHLTLSMESTSNRMHRLGRQELMSGDYLATDQALRQIDRVTAGDILSLANQVFEASQISIAAQGPVDANIFEDVV